MIYVDKLEDVQATRDANPSEAVTLRADPPAPWFLWTPNADKPRRLPNGGFPESREAEPTQG